MAARTPMVDADCSYLRPNPCQCLRCAGLEKIICAALSPGTFHALDVEVAVIVCSAAASPTEAYGMWEYPAYIKGAWISSENTRPPLASTTSAISRSSSRLSTRPIGLCGLH